MNEVIAGLPCGARVLDVGARTGSFRMERQDVLAVSLDLEFPQGRVGGNYVVADAAKLPFGTATFQSVICNHSLEHIAGLNDAVREIGRVLDPRGALYISVPDASTFTDRVYRWLARGGGHVNAFTSQKDVISLVETLTGLTCARTKILYSSLSFLNANNFHSRPPGRIALFAFGNERFLIFLNWALRRIDSLLGTRLAIYGWAFYFGTLKNVVDDTPWINVCVRCGSGHSEMELQEAVRVAGNPIAMYRCPGCGAPNCYFRMARKPAI